MRVVCALLSLMAPSAMAESLVALRTIPARAVLAASDVASVDAQIAGAVADPRMAVGREARVTIFAGDPIRADNLINPAKIERNQIVALVFAAGGLQIATEGRALDRGGAGDVIRVMNLGSRTIVSGRVSDTGTVHVGTDQEKD